MRMRVWQIIIGGLLAVGVAACGSKPKDGRTDTYTSGVISIAVDESFQPILQEEIDVFECLYPLAGIVPRFVTEREAVNLLLRDSVRLAVATRMLTQEELLSFHSRKFFPQQTKVATDGLALIVNRLNTDTLICVDDVVRILTGKVTRWRELYPQSRLGQLTMVFDNQNSSTVRWMMDSICQGAPLAKEQVKAVRTNAEVINYVARTPDAIGVIGVNWLGNKDDSTHLTFRDEVRVMAVSAQRPATRENSYKPYQAYLFYGNYPLARPIYLLLNDPRNALPWGFYMFLTSDRGQRIILKSGLVPATQPVRVVHVKDE